MHLVHDLFLIHSPLEPHRGWSISMSSKERPPSTLEHLYGYIHYYSVGLPIELAPTAANPAGVRRQCNHHSPSAILADVHYTGNGALSLTVFTTTLKIQQ